MDSSASASWTHCISFGILLYFHGALSALRSWPAPIPIFPFLHKNQFCYWIVETGKPDRMALWTVCVVHLMAHLHHQHNHRWFKMWIKRENLWSEISAQCLITDIQYQISTFLAGLRFAELELHLRWSWSTLATSWRSEEVTHSLSMKNGLDVIITALAW